MRRPKTQVICRSLLIRSQINWAVNTASATTQREKERRESGDRLEFASVGQKRQYKRGIRMSTKVAQMLFRRLRRHRNNATRCHLRQYCKRNHLKAIATVAICQVLMCDVVCLPVLHNLLFPSIIVHSLILRITHLASLHQSGLGPAASEDEMQLTKSTDRKIAGVC